MTNTNDYKSKKAVLFDLGNTLVKYYQRSEFPGILHHAIDRVCNVLLEHRVSINLDAEQLLSRVQAENFTEKDFSVRPLKRRLQNIFDLDNVDAAIVDSARHAFMEPILALGSVYPDTIPTLRALKSAGVKTAVVTNSPWGSEPDIWRSEIGRLGIGELVDTVVCCGDVGWRKPARQIFDKVLADLDVSPADSIFVGDDPRWDIVGPQAIGMDAVLIDRTGEVKELDGVPVVNSLDQLLSLLRL